MSDKPASGIERTSALAKSSPTRQAHAVTDDSNAPTVLPQSRESANANTKSPSPSDGTSITGSHQPAVANGEQHVNVGTELGYYRLLKKLGEGGMGSVWQALHTKLDKQVAVKVLPATWSRDPALLTRFEREMKAVGKLEHPNIVRAMDAGEFQGTHYLVMEFNEGLDLSAYIKQRGPQSVTNACEMVRQAALGLAHAHEAGLIHRDIKPSNLFLTKSGKVKILDLGLARVQGDNAGGGQTLTGFGQVLGTPDYMAPEQWENTHSVDGRSDLYALGCTLFYFLTGRAPYSDERHSSLVGKMKGHTLDPIPDLKTARREAVADRPKLVNDLVPHELDALYRKLMSKNPEERFASATELAQALSAFGKSNERSRHAPRDEPNASPTPNSQPTVPNLTPSDAPSSPNERSESTARSAHHAERDGYVEAAIESSSTSDEPTILTMLAQASSSTAEPTETMTRPRTRGTKTQATQRPPTSGKKIGLLLGGLAALILFGGIIIKITSKDGTVTEVKAPEGSKVEIVNVGDKPSKSNKPAVPKPVATTPSAPASAAIDYAAERKAAEGLIALRKKKGKQVAVILYGVNGTGMASLPNEVAQLPVEHFYVGNIQAPGHDLADEDLPAIGACRHVERLNLARNPKLTDAGLAALKDLRHLRWLDMSFCSGVGDGLGTLLEHNSRLEFVSLGSNSGITDTGLAGLQHCRSLETIYLPPQATNQTLDLLVKHCANLRMVYMEGSFGASPKSLSGLRWLRELTINGDHLKDDANITALLEMPSLEILQIAPPMNDELFAKIKPLATKIRQLRVPSFYDWDPGVTSTSWKMLSDFSRLEQLEIGGVKSSLDGPTLLNLANIESLRFLKIFFAPANRQYTDKDVLEFRRRRKDIHLWVDGTDYPSLDMPLSELKKLDETDPLPGWELPAGAPPPVVAPCEPTLAAALQQKWAEFLKRPVMEEVAAPAGLDMKFALIPPGEFRKIFTRPRDPAIEPDMPVRRFRLTKPYALSTTEVTWDQFRQFVEATGYQTEAETNGLGGLNRGFQPDSKLNWRTPGWEPAPNEPVTQVGLHDAEAFCAWLTKVSEDSRQQSLHRLPTEAEWVHACRAGSVHNYVVGLDAQELVDYAWSAEFVDPNPQASPLHLVGTKKPNPFGLHDTLGNVSERVLDDMLLALASYLPTNDPIGGQSDGVIGSNFLSLNSKSGIVGVYAPHPSGAAHVGFRVLKQFDGEPLPGPLDRPLVLRAGQPLSVHALVPRPEKIPGLQSWSLEHASSHNASAAIATSPKGDLIATGSAYGKISLWDRDGRYIRALLGHEGTAYSLDFSRDGHWLVSCDLVSGERGHHGTTARIWNVENGALQAVLPLPGWGVAVAVSPDGKQFAASFAGASSPLLFEFETGGVRHLPKDAGTFGVAWSSNGTKLATSDGDEQLRIWDVNTRKIIHQVDCPKSDVLAWSHDGRWLAMQHTDRKVAIRNVETLEISKTFGTRTFGFASSLAWLPDSKRLVVASEGVPNSVFDTSSGEQLTKFEGNSTTTTIAIFDEGQQAVVESGDRLRFYDTSTGKKLREGKERGGVHNWSILSPNGREVIAQFNDNVFVSDAATGERKRKFMLSIDGQSLLNPSPDGSLLTGSSNVPTLRLIDSQSGKVRHELSHDKGNVARVAWSPDGQWLATGATDKLVRVWNVASGKIEHELAGHTGTIWSLAWSPDGTHLASAAEDKTVRLWDPRAGKLVATYDQFPEAMGGFYQKYAALAWTTDNCRLWIALGQNIAPLDVETGTFGPMENFSNGNIVTFLNTSPDGQRLLAREGYGWTFVRGRDAQDRRLLGQHLGLTAQWHPDSRRFLGWEYGYGTVGFDVETNRRLGLLFPWLTGDHWLCLGPTGHYRGSPGVEDQFVYVAMLPDGSQRTYTPAEFAKQFGWKNDPEKAELLGKTKEPPEPKPTPAAPSTTSNTPTLPETKSSAAIKKPTSNSVASLTPNKTAPITPLKTNSSKSTGPVDDGEFPRAINVPVSALKVDIPGAVPKPKSGQPVSVRQIVIKPASLKELASWSVEPAGHLGAATAVSWSPSGEYLLTGGGNDDSLRLWRVEASSNGPELSLHRVMLGERGGIMDALFSPDGRTIAVTTFYGHNVSFYEVSTGRKLSEFDIKGGQGRRLRWSADGRQVLVPHYARLAVIDPVKGQIRWAEQNAEYVDGAWSADQRSFVAMDQVGKLRWFESATLKVAGEANGPAAFVGGIDLSPDGRWIALGHNAGVQLWDFSSRRSLMDLKGHGGGPVHFAAFEPDRRRDLSTKHPNWPRLMTASGGELIVWNTESGQPLAQAQLHAQIGKAAWSPDGKWIAAAGWNRLVILDAETGKELAVNETGRGHMDGTINLAANGKTLRLHHSQGLRAFNADTGEQIQNLTDFPQGASLASPNDQWLAIYNGSLDRDQLWVVDSETGQQRSSLVGHTRGVTAVNWSPDGKQLATASFDQTARVWNVSDGQQTQLLQHDRSVRAVIWSPDGQQLATCADDDQVRIWTLAKKNQPPRVFDRVPSPVATGPYSMGWSPDGKLIAMADAGASARVLDIKSGKLSDPFIQFVAGMQCVAWSPDGKQILAANGWEVGYRAVAAKESAVVGGLGAPIFWHPDKRRFITGCWGYYPIQAFDTRKVTKLGTLVPRFGPNAAHWVCIGPDGHFRGSENVESQLVVVAIAKDGGQKLYSIVDFSEKYGWKNDPAKARLMKLDEAGGK